MHDTIGGSHRSRRAWLRRYGMLAVVAGAVLLAAACSSSSSSTSTPAATVSAKYQKALAYSQCMRAHGVPNFPDPNSDGSFTVTPGNSAPAEGNVNTVAKATALNTCRHLLPNGGTLSPAQQQQAYNQALRFSRCMRAHGLRDFPDPTTGGGGTQGGPRQNIPNDINPQSTQFQAAQRACRSLMPAGQ